MSAMAPRLRSCVALLVVIIIVVAFASHRATVVGGHCVPQNRVLSDTELVEIAIQTLIGIDVAYNGNEETWAAPRASYASAEVFERANPECRLVTRPAGEVRKESDAGGPSLGQLLWGRHLVRVALPYRRGVGVERPDYLATIVLDACGNVIDVTGIGT